MSSQKEYDHSKAVEANNSLRSFEKEPNVQKIELEQAKAEQRALGKQQRIRLLKHFTLGWVQQR